MRLEFTHSHIYPGATASLTGEQAELGERTTCLVELSDGVVLSTSCLIQGGGDHAIHAGLPDRPWGKDSGEGLGAAEGSGNRRLEGKIKGCRVALAALPDPSGCWV